MTQRQSRYECSTEGHIFGPWKVQDRTTHYRTCVIPGCGHTEHRQAEA